MSSPTILLPSYHQVLIKENSALKDNNTLLGEANKDLTVRVEACGVSLTTSMSLASTLQVAVIVVAAWLCCEHMLRPLWYLLCKGEFPIDW